MNADRKRASASGGTGGGDAAAEALRVLFHRLNNQLGIVLANAELLEARIADRPTKARAAQITEGALEALATVRELRHAIETLRA